MLLSRPNQEKQRKQAKRGSSKEHNNNKNNKMNEQSLTNLSSAVGVGDLGESTTDEYGIPSSFLGLHQSIAGGLSSTTHSHLIKPGILRRRSSEPASNVTKTYSPPRCVRRTRPPANQAAAAAAAAMSAPATPRDLYQRSLSSSSLQQSSPHHPHPSSSSNNNNKLEDGLHQVRWAAGTASPIPKQTPSGVLLYAENFTVNSSTSSISSESRDNKYHRKPSASLALHRNGYNSAPSSRPSTPPPLLEPEKEHGFGRVLRSPKKGIVGRTTRSSSNSNSNNHNKNRRSAPAPTKSATSRSRRNHRHVDPSQRLSRCDFEPIDPMFGDFAPHPASPASSFHNSLPASGFGSPLEFFNDNDNDDNDAPTGNDELPLESMQVILRPQSPTRLWDSMPEMQHHNNNIGNNNIGNGTREVAQQQEEKGKKSEKGDNKKESKKESRSKAHGKSTKHMSRLNNSGDLSSKSNGKKKKSKRLSVTGTVPNIENPSEEDEQEESSTNLLLQPSLSFRHEADQGSILLGMDATSHTSRSVKHHHHHHNNKNHNKKAPVIDFNTDHSPALTAVTNDTTATNGTSITRRSTSSTIPSKDDLFLIEMETFRSKSEQKLEDKERVKEITRERSWKKRKKKKKKKRKSVAGDAITVEFNVEDLSEDEVEEEGAADDDDFDEDDHDYDDDDVEEEHWLDFSESLNNSHQPLEIEWNPPAFITETTKVPRRNSMPSSLQEYEPITPSFVYDKTKRRKSCKVVDAVPNSITTSSIMVDDNNNDAKDPTASAVDAILNPDATASAMSDFNVPSTEEAFEMSHNNNKPMGFNMEDVIVVSEGGSNPTKLVSNEEPKATSHSKKTKSSSGRGRKTRHRSMGHHSETISSTRRGPSGRLDKSHKSPSESRITYHTRKSSHASKSRRRGSTSAIEVPSSVARQHDDGKSKRREESMPPIRSRSNRHRSMSRSKSPAPRTRMDKDVAMDMSSATTRSKMRSSSTRGGKRRGSAHEGMSLSSTRREKHNKSKKSAPSRRANSASPPSRSKSPRTRGDSKARHKSPKPTITGEKPTKRSGAKSGSRKPSGKRRSSMPTAPPSLTAEAGGIEPGREKPRTKSRRHAEQKAMSQSHSALSNPNTGSSRKHKSRSKSIEHPRRSGSLHTNGTKASSKSPKPKTRRRASMSSAASCTSGHTSLDSHIVAPTPKKHLSGQSSWSALTLSTAHSDENGYSISQKEAPPTLSLGAEFDANGYAVDAS